MIRAAGLLLVTPEKKALFLKRGPGSDHPGEWCFPGGHIDGAETAEDAAKRECVEECGSLPEGERKPWTRAITPPAVDIENGSVAIEPVDYTTFLQTVAGEFVPAINGEHVGYAWAPIDQPPQPLHPGCAVALERVDMNELDVARAIAAGRLTSPQRYENISLFDIRITGTSTAYRQALDEFVFRRPENYLTPDFLARCNGLPVVWVHPDKNILDSKEFGDRIIGTVFVPYIKGDEVWSVVKIFNDAAASDMATEQLSTSPGVLTAGVKLKMESGSTLLIEDDPSLIDHLAVVPLGVWDKGGDPVGVISAEIRGDSNMTEEERVAADKARKDAEDKDRADRARADAEAGEKIDKVLSCLDSLSKRMDAMEAEDKAKADAARKDMDDSKMPGEPKEVAADKAKKDAEEEAKKKADADEADEAEKARKDSQAIADRIAAVERMIPKAASDADYAAMADAQAKADKVYAAFGDSAPRPLQGEDVPAYAARLASGLKKHSAAWAGVDLGKLPPEAMAIAQTQIYADAVTASTRPHNVGAGKVRAIKTDDGAGHTIISYVGDSAALFDQFSQRSQRVNPLNGALFNRNSGVR